MRSKICKIGMLGLSFSSPNLGCGALAYAFRELLIELFRDANTKLELVLFTNVSCDNYRLTFEDWIKERVVKYSFRDIASIRAANKEISGCDIVFDFTEGDSFSDIYGIKRFVVTSYFKTVAIRKAGMFIFGPQTYGPFKSGAVRFAAARLIRSASRVYARDSKSAGLIRDMAGIEPFTTTDVAFALPADKVEVPEMGKPSFGLNVSGLLWTGGYNKANQFGLSVDYKQYIHQLIDMAFSKGYQVHLIPHVVGDLYPECDSPVCKEIASADGRCILAPEFDSPMQAKGYIANMDVFTGARMHATIGAFSSGVATIPFSYSPKFEGLYRSIGYPYIIEGCSCSTDEALELTGKWLDSLEDLRASQANALKKATHELSLFVHDLKAHID